GRNALRPDSADPKSPPATVTASGGRLNVANAVACSASPQVWLDSPGSGFTVDVGKPISFSFIATNCADSAGVSASATANGTPVSATPRGDGLYSGTVAPTAGGAVPLSVTASVGSRSTTRSVTCSATQVYSITPGGPSVTVTAA